MSSKKATKPGARRRGNEEAGGAFFNRQLDHASSSLSSMALGQYNAISKMVRSDLQTLPGEEEGEEMNKGKYAYLIMETQALRSERDIWKAQAERLGEALKKVSYFEDDLSESLWTKEYKEWRKKVKDALADFEREGK